MSRSEKWKTIGATLVFALIGAALGVVAYYRQWLGQTENRHDETVTYHHGVWLFFIDG